ncbi:MAG: LTA synthase family protein [Burkholderiaceae bacterium]
MSLSVHRLSFRFLIAALTLLSLSRFALCLWLSTRVDATKGWAAVMTGGLRIDASLLAICMAVPLVLAPWVGHRPLAIRLSAWWYRIAFVLLALLEIVTPTFIGEYDTRPNRLFFEYLVSPKEVGGMLVSAYAAELVIGAVCLAAAAAFAVFWLPTTIRPRNSAAGLDQFASPMRWRWRIPATLVTAIALTLLARGTLAHRPINPSTVAFSNDALVNTLAVNSLYNVAHALYQTTSERSSRQAYGAMPMDRVEEIVRQAAGLTGPPIDPRRPTLHAQTPSRPRDKPLHIVMIVQESLGAQFVSHLGGRPLTPNLDKLAAQAWTFRQAYATGTRSARGLEALTTGFLPTPSEAVLKLPRAQSGFFTLAALLARHGFRSRFVYGGEAHFDNMRAFFLGNGFDEVVDRRRFDAPKFVGTWGASDEDMFRQLDRLLTNDRDDEPRLTVAFTVSNHSPWEFPQDRIRPAGVVPDRDDAVRYADMALGEFFERARHASYWSRTVFLVVADHDARAGGASLLPVNNFHIPALILGADIAPRFDDRLISQVDLAPTLLSLAGVASTHPMPGADLTRRDPARAIMQFGDNYGYLTPGQLTVLEPGKAPREFGVDMRTQQLGAELPADAQRADRARAHALWAEWAYREQRYSLPPVDDAAKGRPDGQPNPL